MDNVQKNAITDYNAPSSEPFRLHLVHFYQTTQHISEDSHLETEICCL
jgi:hypothetical protein